MFLFAVCLPIKKIMQKRKNSSQKNTQKMKTCMTAVFFIKNYFALGDAQCHQLNAHVLSCHSIDACSN